MKRYDMILPILSLRMNFRRSFFFAAALFVIGFVTGPAEAGGKEEFTPIDARPLIEACWELSREDRDSGVTARMRQGTARTVGCLEKIIIEQSAEIFELNSTALNDITIWLDKISEGYQKFIWALYNEHKQCTLFCGTDKHVYHVSAYAGLLESMIDRIIRERNEVGF